MSERYMRRVSAKGRTYWFWRPEPRILALGYKNVRLPDDQQAAAHAAQQLNAQLDEAVAGGADALEKAKREDTLNQILPGARATMAAPLVGTLDAVYLDYQRSRFWRELADSTQTLYRSSAKRVLEAFGSRAVANITPADVEAYYSDLTDEWTKGVAGANNLIRFLRLLLEHARRMTLIIANPAAKPRLVDTSEEGRPWSDAAVAAMVRAADELGYASIGTMILLNSYAGQRQGDVLDLRLSNYRAGRLELQQSKTAARVSIPVDKVNEVRERMVWWLEQRQEIEPRTDHLFPCEGTRKAWDKFWLRHVFRDIRHAAASAVAREAGHSPTHEQLALEAELRDLWFMHLRHTAVTRLADRGVGSEQIRAVTGHTKKSVDQILERYMIRSRRQADAAFEVYADANPPAPPAPTQRTLRILPGGRAA